MAKVQSSNIDEVNHLDGDILEIKFKNGSVYHYHEVEKHKHDALLNASSVGSHFNQHIKNKHRFTKK